MAYPSSNKDELQTLLSERDYARKKLDEYANMVAALSNELDFLHHNICFTCRWRFVPAQSSSRFASNPLWRRLFRRSRRSPQALPYNKDDTGSETTLPTVTSQPSLFGMSVDEVPPGSHTLNSTLDPSNPKNDTPLPNDHSIADTSVDLGAVTETEENEPSDIVVYNPEVEQKLDLAIARTFTYNSMVLCANFSPNGKYLAVGLETSGKIYIYDVETCSQICVLADYSLEEKTDIWTVKFSPDGELLATGGSDHQIRIWDIAQRRVRAMLKGHTDIVSCLVFLPDSRSVISASYDHSLRIWCTRDGSLKRMINHTYAFLSISLSRDGRYMTAANTDESLRIWDVRTGRLVMCWKGHTENIWSTTFVPDGKGLLSGSQDKTVKYWDVNLDSTMSVTDDCGLTSNKNEILTFEGHTSCVNGLAVSPDSRWVISFSDDRTVRIWDARTAAWQCTLQAHNNEFVLAAAFSPEGRHFVTGGYDSRAVLWTLGCKGE